MDSETITARQIGYTYMINSSTFAKRYKDALSNFETWEQKFTTRMPMVARVQS